MSIITVPDNPGVRGTLGETPSTEIAPSPWGPAFRQANTVVSALYALNNSGPFATDPNFDKWAYLSKDGPKYLADHSGKFVGASSQAEVDSIKGRIDQENADRRALEANGAAGHIVMMLAGMADPTIALPVGNVVKAAKEGYSLTRSAISIGAAGAAQAAVQESILQATQETRPLAESAMGIGSATLLSAIIGAGAAKMLSRAEHAAMTQSLAETRAAIDAHAGNAPELRPEAAPAGAAERGAVEVPVAEAPTGEAPGGLGAAAGAAATDTRALEVAPYGLDKVPGVRVVTERMNPLMRVFTGSSTWARRHMADLAEFPGRFRENLEGIPTSQGPSVERLARMQITQERVAVGDELTRLFSEYRFGAPDVPLAKVKAGWQDWMGDPGGKMTFSEFKQEVSTAWQNAGRHEIPQVEQAAQFIAKKLEPWAARAEEAVEGFKRLEPKEGEGYFPHLWNKQKIAAERDKFANWLLGVYSADQQTKAAAKGRLTTLATRLSELVEEIRAPKVVEAAPPPDTRGQGIQYHGTSQADLAPSSEHYSTKNYYGQGFYTTDATDIAHGYSRRGADKTGQRNVFAVQEKRPLKIFDAEQPIPADLTAILREPEAAGKRLSEGDGIIIDALDEKPKNVRELYDKIRENGTGEGWSADSIQELFDGVNHALRTLGYDALSHKGGLRTKKPEHRVVIYFSPETDLAVRKMEPAAPVAKAASREDAVVAATAERDAVYAKIEAEIAAWEGKSANEAKSAIKAREKYAADSEREAGAARLAGADTAIDRVVRRIIDSDRDLTAAELRSRAHETIDRILGSPDGRLPYDTHTAPPKGGMPTDDLRGPLAGRQLDVSNAAARAWIEDDAEQVMATWMRTVVPDTLIAERFGDIEMSAAMRQVNEEFAALSDAAKSDAARTKLEKGRLSAIEDLAGVRDRIRGTYGLSASMPMRQAARVVAAVKNYNVLTSMGMAAISSMPDMAGSVFRYGLTTAFEDAWAPFMRGMMTSSDAWKQSKAQFRTMGIAVETTLASRHRALDDVIDLYKPQSRVERALQWGADKFQLANGLAAWTDWAKTSASMVAGSEILRAGKAVAEGKATAKQITMLAENSINRSQAERIWKAFDEGGGQWRDGALIPNTAEWKDAPARTAFEAAVSREADIAVVTPGQDKPFTMSDPILSVFTQFKSFTAASTQRMLIANLQRHDAQVLQGLIFSLSLGMLSYKVNSMLGGQPTSDKPADWIKEAISRGNLLGWFEEGNALASKASGGKLDIYRAIGAEKPLSRYASRSALDQLLGPTAGKVDSLLKVSRATAKGEWNESDTHALRRLMATQNLFYLRGLFNQVEAGANNAFGIPMKERPPVTNPH